MTRIEQLQKTGIHRLGTPARGFRYKKADGKKVSATDLKRIDQLKIPPAWTDVWINSKPGGTVQAIGRDVAARVQYLYHENHVRRQEAKKFRRMIKFAEALPKMRPTGATHLKQTGLGRDRVMACIMRILSTCFMRPGSQAYASENGSFGIATLRPKHVKVKGDLVEFDFPGKSGVQQFRQIKDRQVAKVVSSLLNHPAREVFKYQNGNDEFVDVKRRHINEYIREVMGENFSAKDFRTWAGTLVCACALARAGTEIVEKSTVRKRKVVDAIKETAEVLGNTPAVCRSSYICPEIINSFETGKIIDNYFNTLEELITYRGRKLHPAEKSLLGFMKRS
ncbi:MAG: DNA topoisomerase IB, partial [Acidobacteriota bacterium]|nr:DNA topoisomerase IB [Acidobacteriota bacterium]